MSFGPTNLPCFGVSLSYLSGHKSKANTAACATRRCQSSGRLNAQEFTGLCTERDIHNLRLILWELFRLSSCASLPPEACHNRWPFWSHGCVSHGTSLRLQITSPVFSIKFSETSMHLFICPVEGSLSTKTNRLLRAPLCPSTLCLHIIKAVIKVNRHGNLVICLIPYSLKGKE